MHWLILISFLFLSPDSGSKLSCCACLPKGIQRTEVVGYAGAKPLQQGKPITVSAKLASLNSRCKRGKLVDGKGKEIYFFRLQGCWGNPPENYQEILEQQNRELTKLRRRYTVIEITCNPGGALIN